MGHAERTCLIGLRLADAVGLEPAQRSSLFYALLLKDAGCSTTAAADRRDLRHRRPAGQAREPPDRPHRPRAALGYLRRNVAPGAPLRQRARHLRAVVAMSHGGARELERMRCERGADIARGIGLDEDAAAAITPALRALGRQRPPGRPARARRSRCWPASRAWRRRWRSSGSRAGAGGRSATSPAPGAAPGSTPRWSTPSACSSATSRFWASPRRRADVAGVEPADRVERADDERLDRVAEAFASIVDAKSPYTARHCAGVAEIADGIAATLGLDDADPPRLLRRAGAPARHRQARRLQPHPRQARLADRRRVGRRCAATRARPCVILRGVPRPRRRRAPRGHAPRAPGRQRLPLRPDRAPSSTCPRASCRSPTSPRRLTAERPYRAALPVDEVLAIMRADAGTRLDARAFAALEAWLPGHVRALAAAA